MKMRIAFFAVAAASLGYLPAARAQQSQPRIPEQLKVVIDATRPPIRSQNISSAVSLSTSAP
jgi:hypothetical protein